MLLVPIGEKVYIFRNFISHLSILRRLVSYEMYMQPSQCEAHRPMCTNQQAELVLQYEINRHPILNFKQPWNPLNKF